MIELARCEDFAIGPLAVRPSSREIVVGDSPVMVEPKVMQVLVALAQAGGRVVSRDELVERCWRGRIVGDDAVNRIIGKLRRIAEAAGGVFRIETVARTGHRLVHNAPVAPVSAPIPIGRRWPMVLWLVPVALAVLLGVNRPWLPPTTRPPLAPQLMPAAVNNLETRGLSAMFEDTSEQTAEGVEYLRRATALAPRSAPVWGSLAMSYVLSLGWTPPGERAAMAARVRDAAAHGLAIDPTESRSGAALVSLVPSFANWSAKEAAIAAAIKRAQPDSGPLAYQQVQFLMAVGRDREALATLERVVELSPLVPWIRAAQINLLAGAGRLDEADRAADEAHSIWPRDRLIWFTRFDLAAFNGQPGRALAMADDRAGWPKQASAAEMAQAKRLASALTSRDPAEITGLIRAMQADVSHGHAAAERLIRAAAAFGQIDLALAAASRLYSGQLPAHPRATMLPLIGLPAAAEPPTAALFLPPGSALWHAPGFMSLMREIGLIDYWRRGSRPDLCAVSELSEVCRTARIPASSIQLESAHTDRLPLAARGPLD